MDTDNKSILLPNSYPGVFQLGCNCIGQYIGDNEKERDGMAEKWESTGATEHRNLVMDSLIGWFLAKLKKL